MSRTILISTLLCTAAFAQPRIVSGPFVDAVTYSSARITWVTDIASSTVIEFGPTTSYGSESQGVKGVKEHSWYLSGLAPGSTYHFRVCSTAGARACSADQVLVTTSRTSVQLTGVQSQSAGVPVGGQVAEPEPPRVVVDTALPSGAYGTPFVAAADCANMDHILASIANLTGSVNYEILLPPEAKCRGQFVFPNRPSHSGWIVVRTIGALPQGRISSEAVSSMATFQTNALPASRYALKYLPTGCSVGSLFWGFQVPGFPLLVCDPYSKSTLKSVTKAAGSPDQPVVLTVPGHGYSSGDVVNVNDTGLGVDDRDWMITVLDSNTLVLNGSASGGSTSGRGSVRRNDNWRQVSHTEGTELPSTCTPDEWFFKSDVYPNTEAGYWCTASNQWTQYSAINTSDGRNYAAIQFEENARRYRFIRIEVTHNPVPNPPPASWSTKNYKQGMIGSLVAIDETNQYIIFDRCDIHGLDYPSRVAHGIDMDGAHIAVIDSRIHKITRWQERNDGGDLEAIAINVGYGPGPGRIENNFVEAIGITIFFPDSGSNVTPPADYEVRRNFFSHPEKYLYGSPLNVSGKNYDNRHLLELKRGRRMVIEGNIWDGNWADGNQGAFIMLSPRPGPKPSPAAIVNSAYGTVTLSSGSSAYKPGTLVSISGTGAANHDGIWKIASVVNSKVFTLENPPVGMGSGGTLSVVSSNAHISDIDIKNNVFRNGPNLLWILGHQDSAGTGGAMNVQTTQRVRLLNNLVLGIDARSASLGGHVSPVGSSRNGRSGIAVFASGGMEDLIVRNNTIYDVKGNAPTFLAFDSTTAGAHAGLDVRDNIFTAKSPRIATISGNYSGTDALNLQWTFNPEAIWTFEKNILCCTSSSTVRERNPQGNLWVEAVASIGFRNPETGDFNLALQSRFKAGKSCFGSGADCTSNGRDPGVDFKLLEIVSGWRNGTF